MCDVILSFYYTKLKDCLHQVIHLSKWNEFQVTDTIRTKCLFKLELHTAECLDTTINVQSISEMVTNHPSLEQKAICK